MATGPPRGVRAPSGPTANAETEPASVSPTA
ncbi:Uncharacterised protein [Mycobacteroides abscessus]|nr:Uncharacterised protein [Mycobacteroides abscessus]